MLALEDLAGATFEGRFSRHADEIKIARELAEKAHAKEQEDLLKAVDDNIHSFALTINQHYPQNGIFSGYCIDDNKRTSVVMGRTIENAHFFDESTYLIKFLKLYGESFAPPSEATNKAFILEDYGHFKFIEYKGILRAKKEKDRTIAIVGSGEYKPMMGNRHLGGIWEMNYIPTNKDLVISTKG
ncbi:hypothetical protein KW787_01595 [Candidatus Pacearchaeota archaeon]|nr:hypothetical protein [Candidatus Pacearchaeota archaeon]